MSEASRAKNRRAHDRRSARWGRGRLRRLGLGWPLAMALGGLSAPAFAQSLPQGGTVVGGSGSIQQLGPTLLQIQQNTNQLAIDWQSFNVGSGSIVRFLQPGADSIALNRVIGPDPSQIFGQIQANGRVVILNPNGIYFGPSSRVDVSGLVATTANIRNEDFMAGRLLFDQASANPDARVVNEGVISIADGGFAVLAAAGVSNTGRIIAAGGDVVLAGTKTFTIDFYGDGLLSFAATGLVDRAPSGAAALVDNSGVIEVPGGRVLMTARAARDVLDNVINTSGIVVATSAQMVNGEIVIDGGDAGAVNVSGTLDASGKGAGQTGGTVKVLGETVKLNAGASIDVAGDAGGGTAIVGGNFKGHGPEPNAKVVYMDAAAMIDASAVTSGNGGKVALWADDTANVSGRIYARGGATGGDGGYIETSGKNRISFGDTFVVDTLAPFGKAGSLLIDPTDFVIQTVGGDMTPAVLIGLLAAADVTIDSTSGGGGTTGTIYINNAVVNTAATARTLTLNAMGDIQIAAGVSSTLYPLNLSLQANGNIVVGGAITTNNGNIVTHAYGGAGTAVNFSSTSAIDVGTGNITLNLSGTVDFGANVTSTGTVSLAAGGAVTQSGGGYFAGNSALVVGGTGSVTLADVGNGFNSVTFNRTGTSNDVTLATWISPNVQASTLGTGNYSLTGQGFLQSGAIVQDAGGGTVDIIGGTGNVTLSSANSFTGALTVTGQQISVSNTLTATGSGSITLNATQNVTVSSAISTVSGDILIEGNVASWTGPYTSNDPTFASASGNFAGVTLAAGSSVMSAGGNIAIAGKGGDTNYNQFGIYMNASTVVSTTGTGAVTLVGEGGASSSDLFGSGGSHTGIYLNGGATGTAVDISTVNGDIRMLGTGGGVGTTDNNGGVAFLWAKARSTGAGSIDITGFSGAGASRGVVIALTGSEVTTSSGNVTITGTGGGAQLTGAGFVSSGVSIGDGLVRSMGAGNVVVDGIQGASGYGIEIGTGASTIGNVAMVGDLTMEADSYLLNGTVAFAHSAASGTINFETDNDATTIGVNGGSGSLVLSGGMLGSITGFANLTIGSATQTGDIQVDNTAFAQNLTLRTQGAVYTNSLTMGSNDLTIYADAGYTQGTGGLTTTGTLTFAGTGAVSATNGGNAFSNLVLNKSGAAAVSLATSGAVDLQASTMGTGALSLTAVGVTQSGALVTGGDIFVDGGTGNIAMTNTGNATSGNVRFATAGAGNVDFYNDIATNFGGGTTVVAGDLTVNGSPSSGLAHVTQSSALSVGGNASFSAYASNVTLMNPSNSVGGYLAFASNGLGDVNYTGAGAVVLGDALVAHLNITAGGNITQQGATALLAGYGATFNAGANAIALNNFGNQFTGPVGLTTTGANDASITNSIALEFGATSVGGNLNVTTTGASSDITQSAPVSVGGALAIVSAGGNITLNQGANTFTGTVDVTNTGTGSLDIQAGGPLTLGTISLASGDLSAVALGQLELASNITMAAGKNIDLTANGLSTALILVSGNVTLNGGNFSAASARSVMLVGDLTTNGGDITLYGSTGGGTGDFSAVNVTATSLVDAGGGNILMSGIGGDSTLDHGVIIAATTVQTTGAGTITLGGTGGNSSGGINVGVYLYAGADVHTSNGLITLNGTGGNGSGTNNPGVAVEGSSVHTTGTGDISVTGQGGYEGAGVVVSGTGGEIATYGGGNIYVTGTGGATGLAGGLFGIYVADLGSGAGTISASGTGSVTLTGTGGAAATTNNHGVVIESATVSAGTGGLSVTGTSGGGATSGGIDLATGGSLVSTGNVTLDGSGSTNTGIFEIGGGPITAGGTVSLTSDNGISLDGSVVTAPGGLTIASTFGNVSLGNSSNTISGNIVATASAGDLTLVNNGTTSIGAINVSNNFGLTSAGTISQIAGITVGGTATFTAISGDITMNSGNVVTGDIVLSTSGGNAAWNQTGAASFGSSSVSGTLAVTASGDISQTGPFTVGSSASFDAGAHQIMLADPSNSFGGSVALFNSGTNAVALSAAGTLDLAASNVGSATTTIYSAGAITQSGILTAAGNIDVSSGGNITMGSVTNSVSGSAAFSTTGNATFHNGGATLLGLSTVGGNFTVTSDAGIGQVGPLSVNSATFNAAGNVSLVDPANTVALTLNATTTSGGDFDFAGTGSVLTGTMNVAGNLGISLDSGSLTQSTAYTVGGMAILATTSSGSITLGKVNTFGAGASVTAADALTISDNQTATTGSFIANAGSTLTVSNASVTTNGGMISLGAGQNVSLSTGTLASNGGNIALTGSGVGSGNYSGIELLSSTVSATGGDITMTGTGGDTSNSNMGIWVGSSTTVDTTGTGNITMIGNGGTGAGGGNVGVFVYAGSISAGAGTISITGTGGGPASSDHGVAVQLAGTVAGTGDVYVTGMGSATGSGNGIVIDGIGSGVSSSAGTLSLDGTGGASAGANVGVAVSNGGMASATAGWLDVMGTAGAGTNAGIDLSNGGGTGGLVSTGVALVSLTGIGAGGADGIAASGTTSMIGGGSATGDISIIADQLTSLGAVTIQTTGTVQFAPYLTSTNIGINNSIDPFNLDGTTLGSVTAGGIVVGSGAQNGMITLGTDAANTFSTPLTILGGTGADVAIDGGLTSTSNVTISTAGLITQSAPVSVTGAASFTGDGGIQLDNPANTMSGHILVSSASGNVTVYNTGPTVFGASNVFGSLDVIATGGDVGQVAAISVGGPASVSADQNITWNNIGNVFGGALFLTNTGAYSISVAASGGLTLGDVSMNPAAAGSFSASATNGLAQSSGAMLTTGTGATTLAGGSANVELGEATNAFGGTLSLSGAGGTLVGTVNGASGATAAQYVSSTAGTFDFNGVTIIANTPPATTTTTTVTQTEQTTITNAVSGSTSTTNTNLQTTTGGATSNVSLGDLTGGGGGTGGTTGGLTGGDTGGTGTGGGVTIVTSGETGGGGTGGSGSGSGGTSGDGNSDQPTGTIVVSSETGGTGNGGGTTGGGTNGGSTTVDANPGNPGGTTPLAGNLLGTSNSGGTTSVGQVGSSNYGGNLPIP
ncbi:MAG: filamentous hemagglutinin N-terminal domain-containing protein [Alphaproteobacteria bacterium]|nr:filamentous hemagglutinin N-terminal domain-containing protein [Alphaproteobacteria bacterium]